MRPPSPNLPYGSLTSSFEIANCMARSGEYEYIDFYDENYRNPETIALDKCRVTQRHFNSKGIESDKYDLLYLSGGHFEYDSFSLRPDGFTPVVAEIGTTHYPSQWSSLLISSLQNSISGNDGFIFKSTRTKNAFDLVTLDWEKKYGIKIDCKNTVITNGVNLEKHVYCQHCREDFRKKFNLSKDAILFLAFSRIAPNSKVDYESLIVSWKTIVSNAPNAILVISGAIVTQPDYTKYPRRLLEFARDVGVYENIRVIANPYDIWKNAHNYLMSGCDVFLHTTKGLEESTSNVVLEALAHSLPVIATNWAGMNDLINNRKNGFLLDTWSSMSDPKLSRYIFSRDSIYLNSEFEKHIAIDYSQLTGKVVLLSRNRNLLGEMRKCARNSVEADFGIDKKVEQRTDFFKAIILSSPYAEKCNPQERILVPIDKISSSMASKILNDNSTVIFNSFENTKYLPSSKVGVDNYVVGVFLSLLQDFERMTIREIKERTHQIMQQVNQCDSQYQEYDIYRLVSCSVDLNIVHVE